MVLESVLLTTMPTFMFTNWHTFGKTIVLDPIYEFKSKKYITINILH